MITNTKATIYNAYTDTTTRMTVYKRTVLDSVHWEGIEARSKSNNVIENADSVKVSIPFKVKSDSLYLKPKAFNSLVDKSSSWTLKTDDVIVKGEIPENISFEELENDYDDVVTITSVDTADYGSINIRHWEVNAK